HQMPWAAGSTRRRSVEQRCSYSVLRSRATVRAVVNRFGLRARPKPPAADEKYQSQPNGNGNWMEDQQHQATADGQRHGERPERIARQVITMVGNGIVSGCHQ